ncbi:putative oxidoreductase GLYR1 like [Pseudolycoriella hygida]|uniref:Cytokine-like nuclear factor N-PAC n=1 Tax=Pseudolycoriella hygida TaxID=35572 RepID=A0A9Q0S932_9DIPT|nr:putative oxidoreductase GLYR1 like [Pseudolycoriella hygida]
MEKDLVWAKMKGYPPWPGKICTPKASVPKPKGQPAKWIFFFGSKNYSWIEDNNLKPYLEHRDSIVKTIKSNPLKEAVKRMDEYLSDPEKYKENADTPFEPEDDDTDTAFNKLRESDESSEPETPKAQASKIAIKKLSSKKKSVRSSPPLKFRFQKKVNGRENSVRTVVMVFGFDLDPELLASETKSKAKRLIANNGEFDDTPSKRARPSPKDESKIDSTSEFEPYVPSQRRNPAELLLNRPQVIGEPPQISMNISQSQKLQNIVASAKTFGFLGVGIMGSGIVKNLLNSGHKVIIWNRDPSKSRKLEELGAQVAMTPCDVAEQVDIIFSCVSDPLASKELVFGNCGIISSNQHFDGKGYVEMSGLDGDTSQDIADAIVSKGGRYLEAPFQGSRIEAEEGTLIILAAGDRTLFDDCQSCFKAMGKNSFFLGDVGNASKMYLVLQLVHGVSLGGLAEALALADRSGLQQKDVLEVLELTTLSSTYIIQKGKAIIEQNYAPHQPLTHMQKDLRLGLALSEQIEHGMPITAATNEVFKHAKRNGYSEHDVSAVYIKSRI